MVPHENVLAASITQSQHFLPAVAEGKIVVRPWIERTEDQNVLFSDGSRCEADAILFGTGYRLALTWLAAEIAENLGIEGDGLDLHGETFHPDLKGLLFVGLYNQVGPHLPVLELQARWIAYCLAGVIPMPTPGEMAKGVAASRARRQRGQDLLMNHFAVFLARKLGVEPDLKRWPDLERALLFGPLSPISFRLEGPDALEDAPARIKETAALFGAIRSDAFTPRRTRAPQHAPIIGPRGVTRKTTAAALA